MNKRSKLIRNDIILAVFVALISVGCYVLFALPQKGAGETVEVYSDGELVATMPISKNCEYAVEDKDFVIAINDKKVTVTKTHCNDRVCETMKLDEDGGEIVCLPNKIVIRLSKQKDTAADITAG